MILTRLYELAQRNNLCDDVAFATDPIAIAIRLSDDGAFRGLLDLREAIAPLPGKKTPATPKLSSGREVKVPRAHGNTANRGFARYFADTLERVLPVSDEEKSRLSRETFWKQISEAAADLPDTLAPLQAFRVGPLGDPAFAAKLKAELETFKLGLGARCTFAVERDGGKLLVERTDVRAWYTQRFAAVNAAQATDMPLGICQLTGMQQPLARSHRAKLTNIPGGLATGVSLISGDKAAFQSYGLDGAASSAIGVDAADAYCFALQALIDESLTTPEGAKLRSKLRCGEGCFLFWTADPAVAFDPISFLDNPTPEDVTRLIESPFRGAATNTNDAGFFCLSLSGAAARAVVRDYLETPLAAAKENLARWFTQLSVPARYTAETVVAFPLYRLIAATHGEHSDPSPSTAPALIRAAFRGDPLPESIMSSCLSRLRAEGSKGFTPERIALIKLSLTRLVTTISENLMLDPASDALPDNPAFLCGMLLAKFEKLQYHALGDVNATVTDRFYGAASCTPALVFPRLFKSAQAHLSKLDSTKPGLAFNLRRDIASLAAAIGSEFPPTLPLRDQGRFALGFYNQLARDNHQSQTRKLEKAAAEAAAAK